jgi:hypothetical protein
VPPRQSVDLYERAKKTTNAARINDKMMATPILTLWSQALWGLIVWIFMDDVGSTTGEASGRACTGPQTVTSVIATTSPVGLTTLRGARFKAVMGDSFTDYAGLGMFDASSEDIEGTGFFVCFASQTALVFG